MYIYIHTYYIRVCMYVCNLCVRVCVCSKYRGILCILPEISLSHMCKSYSGPDGHAILGKLHLGEVPELQLVIPRCREKTFRPVVLLRH